MGLTKKAVDIATQNNPTNGNFTVYYYEISIPGNETIEKYISFPFDINIIRAKYIDKTEFEGDYLDVSVSPNQLIGLVLANEAIGSSSIKVDATVIRYLNIGYEVNLATPTSYTPLGRCIGKKPDSIQFETPLTSEVLAGSYILITVPIVRDLQFSGANINADIEGTLKTNFLPKGSPILFRYKNNSDQPKKFIFDLEVLY